jgi:hypothetical protein
MPRHPINAVCLIAVANAKNGSKSDHFQSRAGLKPALPLTKLKQVSNRICCLLGRSFLPQAGRNSLIPPSLTPYHPVADRPYPKSLSLNCVHTLHRN